MNKGVKWIGGIIIAGTFLAGVGLWVKRQINLALDFCYKIRNFKVIRLDAQGCQISFLLLLKNQSDITAEILHYKFTIYVNDFKIADIFSNKYQKIKAHDVSEIDISVAVNWKDLGININVIAQLINYYLTSREKIILKLDGVFTVQLYGIPLRNIKQGFEFNLKELLTPSKEPSTCTI